MAPKSGWREWLTLGRIVPLLTVLAAITGNVLDWFKVIDMTVAENLMLATIALLAFDGLTERVQVLGRIQRVLERLERPKAVFTDLVTPIERLPSLKERLSGAKTLWINGISMPVLTTQYEDVFVEYAREHGLRIKFLLVAEESSFTDELACMDYPDVPGPKARLKSAVGDSVVRLKSIQARSPQGRVEIRQLSKHMPLQSMVIVDGDLPSVQVQVYLYTHLGAPPGVFRLRAETDPIWCNFFLREFRLLWDAAEEVP